jgi:hypothetical protein
MPPPPPQSPQAPEWQAPPQPPQAVAPPPQAAPPQAWHAPPPQTGAPAHYPAQYPPQYAPQYAQQPQPGWPPPARRAPPPTWLLGVAFALAILGIGAAVYFGVQRFGSSTPADRPGLENPANASRQKVSNPLQKYVEVVGLRMMTDKDRKPIAKFIVVNHSAAEITGLAASVTLWASTSRSEEDSIGSFNFRIPSLGPNDAKEVTSPLRTKLKMYELPDWQNATAEVQITSPQ